MAATDALKKPLYRYEIKDLTTSVGDCRFSHLPLDGQFLKGIFTDVIGVRENLRRCPNKKQGPRPWLAILYTEGGEAVYEFDQQRILERSGSLRIQSRDLIYTERIVKTPWQLRYLLLSGPMADDFQRQFWRAGRPQADVYDAPPAAWRRLVVELVELTFDQPAGWPWRFLSRLGALFDALLGAPHPNRFAGDLLARAQRLVEAEMDNPWHLNDLAEALRLDPKTLARRFQRIVGQPPAAWMRLQRMTLARKFLNQGLSVTAVSDQLGFESPSCFSRQFRAVMGAPPSMVRRAPPLRR